MKKTSTFIFPFFLLLTGFLFGTLFILESVRAIENESVTVSVAPPVTETPGRGHPPSASPSPSAPAATVKTESRLLFESGVEAFASQSFPRAITHFEQLLREYPSSSFRLEATFYLGQSYLQAKQFAEAVGPLQSTISLANQDPIANEARVLLGNTYPELGRSSEAFLVSEELLRQKDLRTTLHGKALLIRAQAQSALKQPIESEKTFMVFQVIAEQDPELERELARSYLVSLLMKSAECEKFPSSEALPEDQLLDQLNRKSICLLEMGALLSKSARTLTSDDLRQSSDLILSSYRSYSKHCENPPLSRETRTDEQWKTARTELTQKLKDSCQSTFQLLMESLKNREAARPLETSLKTSPKTSLEISPKTSAETSTENP